MELGNHDIPSVPHGIMFHHFRDHKHFSAQGSITADQFAEVIEYYGRDRILTAREWFERAENGSLKNSDVCLTFDDALLCQYEIALPVLDHFKLTAFWFVYSSVIDGGIEKLEIYGKFRITYFESIDDFYDAFFRRVRESAYDEEVEVSLQNYNHDMYRYFPHYSELDTRFRYVRDVALGREKYEQMMNLLMQECGADVNELAADLWLRKDHVQEIHSRGHMIGLHSHTHPTALANLAFEDQEKEYVLNFERIKSITGRKPETMSHPCNSYNTDTLAILEGLGIRLGFRANMEDHFYSRYEYPREDHSSIIRKAKL